MKIVLEEKGGGEGGEGVRCTIGGEKAEDVRRFFKIAHGPYHFDWKEGIKRAAQREPPPLL